MRPKRLRRMAQLVAKSVARSRHLRGLTADDLLPTAAIPAMVPDAEWSLFRDLIAAYLTPEAAR